jgi:hypothetical protein
MPQHPEVLARDAARALANQNPQQANTLNARGIRFSALFAAGAVALGLAQISPGQITPLSPQGATSPGVTAVLYDSASQSYRFQFVGDEALEYRIDVADPAVQGGLLRIQESTTGVYPVYNGGAVLTNGSGALQRPGSVNVATVMTARSHAGNTVTLVYSDTIGGITLERTHEFTLVGKSLKIRVKKQDTRRSYFNNYVGTTFGTSENAPGASRVIIPYMENMDVTMVGLGGGGLNSKFYQTFIDFTQSSGSVVSKPANPHAYASGSTTRFRNGLDVAYRQLSNGQVNGLDETFWVTLTSSVQDTFVHMDNPASPHRAAMASAYVLNFADMGGSGSAVDYARYRYYVGTMASYGVENLMAYLWGPWAQTNAAGDQVWPDVLPPNPAPGPVVDLLALIGEIQNWGYSIGAYTYYYTFVNDPLNQYWDPTKTVKNANGANKLSAWGPPLLAPDAAVPLAASIEQDVKNQIGTNLCYQDTLSGHFPHDQLLSEWVPDGHISTIGAAISAYKALFQQSKNVHGGPYLGEGALFMMNNIGFDSMYAGYVDGWERMLGDWPGSGQPPTPALNDTYFVVPDYELSVVKPRAVGLGFGFPQRFKDTAYPIPQNDFDEFLATYISYGHVYYMNCNGIVGDNGDYVKEGDEIRAYYMLSASLQPRYINSEVTSVEYFDDAAGVYRRLSGALKLAMDLRNPRQRLTYANGLVIHVNHATTNWLNITAAGRVFTIPPNGWVAYHPCSGLLEFSAIPSTHQHRFDYVIKPGCFEMIDGRGTQTTFGTVTGKDFHVTWVNGFTVTEGAGGVMQVQGSRPAFCTVPYCPD